MRVLICDDEQMHCEIIKKYIVSNLDENSECVIDIFHSAKDLVTFCLKTTPDVLFLDIELGDMNGIELARHLRNEFPNLILIYFTCHHDYVFSCFESEPFNFLRKPVNKEEFDKTFRRILSRYMEIHKYIPIKWQNDSVNVEIKDICYIEGCNRHLLFRLYNGGRYEIVGKIDEVFSYLKSYGFVKSHQSFIVNMRHIQEFGENEIYMKNGEKVMMSVRNRLKIKETYSNYLYGRNH